MPRSALLKRLTPVNTEAKPTLSMVRVRLAPRSFDALLLELPQHFELMSARLQNGENLYSVLHQQGKGAGKFGAYLKRLALRLQLGQDLESALEQLVQEANSPMVSEFVNKLTLALRRGTPMAAQVALLAASARASLKVQQLRSAGRNELKMLIPLVFLILPVTIGFAVFPSLQLLQLGI